MGAHLKWRFEDPVTATSYTFEVNPNQMSSPFPIRNIQAQTTTAVGGKPIMFEAPTAPHEWTFGGEILTAAHYEALRFWCAKKQQCFVYDHFGRKMTVVFVSFDPAPKRAMGRYWRHTYTVKCLVTAAVTAPTVAEVGA